MQYPLRSYAEPSYDEGPSDAEREAVTIAEVSRRDFGIDLTIPMDAGGVAVGDTVSINLEIEAVLPNIGRRAAGAAFPRRL